MFRKIYLVLILYFYLLNFVFAKDNIFIVSIVEDQIVTNHDIIKESDYLKILNPKLNQLGKKQIQKIAKDSLINEIIKKNEIEKILDMDAENTYVSEYLKDLYTKLNFQSETDFKDYLSNTSNYSFDKIKEKIKIEVMWNELIYFKYGDQVNIDKQKLIKRINNLGNEIRNEYKLSEIVFKKKKDISLDALINKINLSIIEIGFNNAANIYSISESSKLGGDIGWINENNLSETIFNKIKNLKQNEVSDVIQLGNNYIILKINETRQINIPINKEEELNKMIKFETNKQLNQFSKIFFDKAKINYSINEK